MKTHLSRILPLLLLVVATGDSRAQDTAALHAQLAGVYNQWRAAMVGKNLGGWQATTSRARQVEIKNRIFSERNPYPSTLFNLPVAPPDLRALKSLQLKTKGPTAKLVYFGKVDFGVGGRPTDNLLVLDFEREGARWKYAGAEFVNISALEGVREQLQAGNLQFLASKDFEPSGVATPVPVPLNGPVKYIAKAYVYCPGREVQLQVNKISRHLFQNTKEAEVVIGGARDGRNEVQFLIKPLPGSEGIEPLTVRIYLLSEVRGVKPIKIFDYEVKEKERPKGSGTLNFQVTPDVVRKLRGG